MATVCTQCVKAPALLRLIEVQGAPVAQCSLCKRENVRAIDAEARALKGVVRALIRYYFSEWDYNTHLGGESLQSFFDAENPILHHGFDGESLEDAILPSIEEGYETSEVPISIHAGYGEDGGQLEPLGAMRNSDDERLWTLSGRVAKTNYFLLESEIRDLLTPFQAKLKRVIAAGTVMHRARIGVDEDRISISSMRREYVPFVDGALGSPPQTLASAGRLNRAGVSFMYLATDHDTAINEVRPHPGHTVSTGQFLNTRELTVADFSALRIEEFSDSDVALDDYWMLNSIDRAFSVPVTPEQRTRYMLTQTLADGVRQLGFDGVAYRSSVGSGANVAFFDPRAFEYVPNSARVVSIQRVDYAHEDLPVGQKRPPPLKKRPA